MKYKKDWRAAKEKWRNYWNHCNTGRPLMCVIARKPEWEPEIPLEPQEYSGRAGVLCQGGFHDLPQHLQFRDMDDQYLNAQGIVDRYHFFCQTHEFLGESFPNLNIDLGPGSLAAYLGCDLGFSENTVWTKPCWEDLEEAPKLKFDPDNQWFCKHLQLAEDCARLAKDDFLVDMPDLMENLDSLAALRGPTELLMDLMEEPALVKERLQQINDVYYEYFDRFYDIIRDKEGGNAYTVFQIWGPGKTTVLHCDTSAMISPACFRDFAVPYLRQQAQQGDCVLYHLDGAEAIRHLDAILEIDEIDVLQWTSGNTGPDGTYPQWDEIYEKSLRAGKSIWVKVYSGDIEDWIRNTDRLVQKFGSHSMFLHYPEMSYAHAQKLLQYAEEHWCDVKGTMFG